MDFLVFLLLPGIVVSIFFLIGFMGAFLPIIPNTFLIWLGILIHKLWVGDNSVSWNFIFVITGLAILAQIIDWVCAYWGARRFGGSWRAGLGALIGIIVGPFVLTPFIGIIVGPIVGAIVGELLGGKSFGHASKAGFGTLVGGLIAFFVKLAITCFMIGGFFISVMK